MNELFFIKSLCFSDPISQILKLPFISAQVFLAIITSLSICIASFKDLMYLWVFPTLYFDLRGRIREKFPSSFYFAIFTTLLVKKCIAEKI